MKYKIPVVALIQDDQAGGMDVTVYATEEELLADHGKAEDGVVSPEDREAILNNEDEYENGNVEHGEIVVEVGKDGKAKLAKSFHFHGGQ